MSTRGLYGFILNGQEVLAYNHSDSYPSGIGVDALKWLRGAKLDKVVEQVKALQIIKDDPGDKWYSKLRDVQGDFQGTLDSGYVVDYHEFANESLHCEWAYIVDLDRAVLQVYKGLQKVPHTEGRFAELPGDGRGYYPIKLVKEWSLERLPQDAEFCAALNPKEEVDAAIQ